MIPEKNTLTDSQEELYKWLVEYINQNNHSPSIRQMMTAMGLRSPAPIQSRLKHLQDKGKISWEQGKSRTLKIIDNFKNQIPVLGSIAAGGLIETFDDITEEVFDVSDIFSRKDVFALTVNGDSMIEAFIANGDMVLMEKITSPFSIKNGDIVSAMVPGSGTTLKYFFKKGNQITLNPANPAYEPIILNQEEVQIQGKLLAVWRKA
tara:strand:+ start:307 stop:924 length:618 start_codon:yes stop_codon:yes gene_type:complete